MEKTTLENKIAILADVWLNYRNDEEFADFCEYNDIGLPAAYLIKEEMVEPKEIIYGFIEETFDLLLAALDVEDTGFETFEEVLAAVDGEETND